MREIQSTVQYKWFQEVWNNGNENAIDALFTKDATANGLTDQKGPAGFKAFYNNFKTQFSEVRVDVEDVIVEGDMEVSRCTVHAKEAATGKAVRFEGACLTRIEEGRIAEAWNYYDFVGMYQQLGYSIVPPEPNSYHLADSSPVI